MPTVLSYAAEALLAETVQQHLSGTGLQVLTVCSTPEEACMPVSPACMHSGVLQHQSRLGSLLTPMHDPFVSYLQGMITPGSLSSEACDAYDAVSCN